MIATVREVRQLPSGFTEAVGVKVYKNFHTGEFILSGLETALPAPAEMDKWLLSASKSQPQEQPVETGEEEFGGWRVWKSNRGTVWAQCGGTCLARYNITCGWNNGIFWPPEQYAANGWPELTGPAFLEVMRTLPQDILDKAKGVKNGN